MIGTPGAEWPYRGTPPPALYSICRPSRSKGRSRPRRMYFVRSPHGERSSRAASADAPAPTRLRGPRSCIRWGPRLWLRHPTNARDSWLHAAQAWEAALILFFFFILCSPREHRARFPAFATHQEERLPPRTEVGGYGRR